MDVFCTLFLYRLWALHDMAWELYIQDMVYYLLWQFGILYILVHKWFFYVRGSNLSTFVSGFCFLYILVHTIIYCDKFIL